jgi:alpha-amylase
MKSVFLSIRIHLPVIYQKQHFSEINPDYKFYHVGLTQEHVKNVAKNNLLPFLTAVSNLSKKFGSTFRIGMSISGITIKLLEEFAPDIIDQIKQLSDVGCIDFFSEPWSHSILPYFDRKELVIQTNSHRKTIQSVFNKEPLAFVAHSPVQSNCFMEFVNDTGFQSVFTYSYHSTEKIRHLRTNGSNIHPKAVFYIHHVLSEKFQKISVSLDGESEAKALTPFLRYSRKHASLVKPLVLFFDPLKKNLTDFKNWELVTSALLNKTGGSFYSLSDLADISNYFAVEHKFSNEMLSQFRLPNYWMKNTMQKEAFRQFHVILELVRQGEHPYLTEAWNFLQDLNNFFYMSDSFFIDVFAHEHFNPFRSPHEAFTNYMNAASRFWHMDRSNKKQQLMNTRFLFASSN